MIDIVKVIDQSGLMDKDYEILILKDINKVSGTLGHLEVQRFWACFIFLFVLPPKHRDVKGIPKWKSKTYANEPYIPQCRYDQFIASHSTSCEHHTNFFAYYHRNLISKYQLALNEADYALRNSESSVMQEIWREARKKRLGQELQSAIDYYQRLIEIYKQELKGSGSRQQKVPWVAAFYWNPLDFKTKIVIPEIFSNPPKPGENPMFDFHKLYKGWNFGEVNYFQTWEAQRKNKWWFTRRYFARVANRFTGEQMQALDGKYTGIEHKAKLREQISKKINYNANYRAYESLQKRNGIAKLSNQTDKELNYNLGGEGCEYIKTSEAGDLQEYTSFNEQLPYFNYAKALITPFENMCVSDDNDWGLNRDGFLAGRNSISTPHDQIHNNCGFILSDPSFSITHPLFMLYHGYIEYMTEQYLRMAKKYDKDSKAFMSLDRFLKSRIPITSYQRDWRNFQLGFGNFLAAYYRNNRTTLIRNGQYPVFEWFDNTLNNFSLLKNDLTHYARGTYEDLMAVRNQNGDLYRLRYSDELRGYYESQIQDMNLPEELKQYPFNFTFDILIDNQKRGQDYPDYLQELVSQIRMSEMKSAGKLAFRETVSTEQSLQHNFKTSSKPPGVLQSKRPSVVLEKRPILTKQMRQKVDENLLVNFQAQIKRGLGPSQLQDAQLPSKIPQTQKTDLNKFKQKLKAFNTAVQKYSTLYGRVQYPSDLESFVAKLTIRIKNLSQFKFNNSGEESISHLKDKVIRSNGKLQIQAYSVFDKQSLSSGCPRCLNNKTQTFNLMSSFKGVLYPLFIDLHANLNLGVLYDSRDPLGERNERSFAEMLETSNNHPGGLLKFQIVSGAIEIRFRVILCRNVYAEDILLHPEGQKQYEMRLSAESIDQGTGKSFVWLKAYKNKAIDSEIIFEQLSCPGDAHTKENPRQLVYRNFVGELLVKKGAILSVKEFEFNVQNYWVSASYDIRIDQEDHILVRQSEWQQRKSLFF